MDSENEKKIHKVYFALAGGDNQKAKLSIFMYLFKDKIKVCDQHRFADYILTFHPKKVVIFNKRLVNPPKEMSAEQFFTDVLPKHKISEEEKKSAAEMIKSKDEQSKRLGLSIIYNSDIYNDSDSKYLLQISSLIGHYNHVFSGTDPELSFFKNVLSYKASKFYEFARKRLEDSDAQSK